MGLIGRAPDRADRATVRAALNDAEAPKAAIPGRRELTGDPGNGFEATVKRRVGPVSATCHDQVALSKVVEGSPTPSRARARAGRRLRQGLGRRARATCAWGRPRAARGWSAA